MDIVCEITRYALQENMFAIKQNAIIDVTAASGKVRLVIDGFCLHGQ